MPAISSTNCQGRPGKVQQIETDRQQWLNHFLFLAPVLLLIVLLYIGFYYSVKLTITQLIKSAEAVTSGNLDQEMHTRTKDELFSFGASLGSHENTAESPTNEASPSQYHRWVYWA